MTMESAPITLFELNEQIRYSLYEKFPETIWVIAEINELRVNRSGHCYLTLVEKDTDSDHLLAQARAIIWSSAYRIIKPYFENSTGQVLASGIKILAKVMVEFHELYSLSLVIKDIEPSFTVGELEKQKQDILRRLSDEGILKMNHGLELPVCPQRLAIISSETAAGLGDFRNQLANNPFEYAFQLTLFQATMQGKEAESSIVSALDSIFEQEDEFEAVILIRGGGSQTDLLCFNSYKVAYHITQFPLPVITGIGHERDETIADIVAHTALKTPTAVAEFLIDRLSAFEHSMEETSRAILDIAEANLNNERHSLLKLGVRFSNKISGICHRESMAINNFRLKTTGITQRIIDRQRLSLKNQSIVLRKNSMKNISIADNYRKQLNREIRYLHKEKLTGEKYHLEALSENLDKHNPVSALSRGFTITYQNGKRISSLKGVSMNHAVETWLPDGILISNPLLKRGTEEDDTE